MNRNISMLILSALVVGTLLIAYNKWILRESYTLPESSGAELTVQTTVHGTDALHSLVLVKQAQKISTLEPAVKKSIVRKKQGATVKSQIKQHVQPAAPQEKVVTAVVHKVTTKENNVRVSKKTAKLIPITVVSYAKDRLIVAATSAFTYKIFGLNQPDRLVVDVIGRFVEKLPKPVVTKDDLVKAVRLGHHEDRVRIVLDLKDKLPGDWSATSQKGTLSVVIR